MCAMDTTIKVRTDEKMAPFFVFSRKFRTYFSVAKKLANNNFSSNETLPAHLIGMFDGIVCCRSVLL